MTEHDDNTIVRGFIENYITMVRAELVERWKKWKLDLTQREVHEVIGALLACQVSKSTQLASAPSIWNGHVAPLILRTMTDTYITLAWITRDPIDRAKKYIVYGLGQEKLHLEHRKAQLQTQGIDPNEDPLIRASEEWLNSQRYTFLTEVNVGSWAGLDTRSMADEADCIDLYNLAYTPFSAATHSMWQHVSKYNLIPCSNPLHGYHQIPVDMDIPFADPDYLYRAAKYVEKSYKLFDETFGVKVIVPSAFVALAEALREFSQEDNDLSNNL
jgi:hypothetical protein